MTDTTLADGERPDLLAERLLECGRFDDAEMRLGCFDALLDSVRSSPAEQGGRSEPPVATEELLARSATIERLERRPYGEYVFHLSTGEVWTELEAGRSRFEAGMAVDIERTPLGSYVLSAGPGSTTRVRRVGD